MKRMLSGLLVVLILFSISACKNNDKEISGDLEMDASGTGADSADGAITDFDENGNLNLLSSKNRSVIKTSFGYYIFHFNETRLARLTVVYNEETPEAAQALYDTMMSPEYTNTDFARIDLSGQYVVGVVQESSKRYSYLFRMSKLDILNSFYNKNAESKEQ